MKKNLCIVFLFITFLITSTAFAYISGKTIVKENQLFCPSEISCSGSTIDSCKIESTNPTLWNFSTQSVYPTTYPLRDIASPYHYSGFIDAPQYSTLRCMYYDNSGHYITLTPKIEANLEAYYDKTTKWRETQNPYMLVCTPPTENPHLCPLKESSAILIHNSNLASGILAAANGIKISGVLMGNKYLILNYDDALVGCGVEKLCKIFITSPKGAVYGSVTVDMDNKLKILSIDQTRPSEVTINRINSFNAIDVQYPSIR